MLSDEQINKELREAIDRYAQKEVKKMQIINCIISIIAIVIATASLILRLLKQ